MSKLTKFLEENKCKLSAESTLSVYYLFKGHKIRVSTHTSESNHMYLNILIPKENRKQYIVSLNAEMYIYNSFTELKSFLRGWFIVIGSNENQNSFVNKELSKARKKVNELQYKFQLLNKPSANICSSDFTSGQRKQINLFLVSNNNHKRI